MARTMMLFQTSEFEHREIDKKFYDYVSISQEYELAHKMRDLHNRGDFVIILGNDDEPIRSIDF